MRHWFTAGPPIPEVVRGETYHRDRFRAHLGAVGTLTAAGINPPPEWVALRGRYAAYIDLGNNAAGRLAAEVVAPTGADLSVLRNAAIVEELGTAEADAAVNLKVQAAVAAKLESLYEPTALKNYRAIAGSFDEAAGRFTTAAQTVDVEAGGETLVSVSPAEREAWLSAPALAAELDGALALLFAAAALAGAPGDVAFISGATDIETTEHQVALACDPGRAHRRKVWSAWSQTSGRTGRWGPLTGLGVQLRAASNPATVAPYERPTQPVAVASPGGRISYWDRHDGPLAEVLPGHHPVNAGWIADKPPTTAAP